MNKTPIQEALERFREKFVWSNGGVKERGKDYSVRVLSSLESFLSKELALAEQRGREEALELFDIELEAWMTVHENQDRSFDTQSLVKHMKKALFMTDHSKCFDDDKGNTYHVCEGGEFVEDSQPTKSQEIQGIIDLARGSMNPDRFVELEELLKELDKNISENGVK